LGQPTAEVLQIIKRLPEDPKAEGKKCLFQSDESACQILSLTHQRPTLCSSII